MALAACSTVGREGPREAALEASQARERQRDENAEQQRCRQLAYQESTCSRRCDTDGTVPEEEGCEAEHFSEFCRVPRAFPRVDDEMPPSRPAPVQNEWRAASSSVLIRRRAVMPGTPDNDEPSSEHEHHGQAT